jgi:hypothetical protein
MHTKRCVCVVVALASTLVATQAAHAQFGAISRGLYLAGFRIDATDNPLTKGVDFSTSRSFFPGSNTLHYGVGTLTLNGALTMQGYVAKKPIPSMSFGISSASGRGQAASPISYTLSIPRPTESITVTGTATINTSIQVDQTGFYHRVIDIDNRGTVTTDGLVDSENNLDFTLGPIDQTGNIFLEGLQGLVGGTSTANANSLASMLGATESAKLTQADIDALDLNDPEQLKLFVNAALVQGIADAAVDPSLSEDCTATDAVMVPEPATLILLGLSSSLFLMGARRRRAAA